jgi:glycerophosphoryl diester phosphodiesterase
MIKFLYLLFFANIFLFTGPIHGQLIIAHRGASADAPENTLAAFNLAWEQGADGIEADFYLSQDGDIICTHDERTSRLTGRKVDVSVSKTNIADLRKLDVGSWKNPKFAGAQMPTLREVLKTIPEGKKIFIEIKCGVEIVPVLKKQLAEFPHLKPEQLIIICFKKVVIKACREQLPDLQVNWLQSIKRDRETKEWKPSEDAILASLIECGASGLRVSPQASLFSPEFVERIRQGGFGFHSWTIDTLVTAERLRALGVDSITTNTPALMRRGLAEKG